jgi:hypothetical protein
VYILSAKFGLIGSDQPIPNYDRRITGTRATELRESVSRELKAIIRSRPWKSIGVCVGRDYTIALEGCLEGRVARARITVLAGGLGNRLTALCRWLRELRNGVQ